MIQTITVAPLAASALDTAMRWFPYVFHPTTVLGVGIGVLIYYEWKRERPTGAGLYRRLGGFLGAGLLAFVPTLAFMAYTGQGIVATTQGNDWRVDWLVGWGIVIAAGTTWLLWRRYQWGPLVPGAMEALVAVMVPYLALSPFWNVSGHVIIALLPTLYLTLVDAKFWPLNVVPLVMVPNRIYLDAHTTGQTLTAFVLAAVITVLVFVVQRDDRQEPASRPTPP